MGIERMSRLTVEGSLDKLDDALVLCCESKQFQMTEMGDGSMLRSTTEQNPYESAYNAMNEMAAALKIKPEFVDYSGIEMVSGEEFAAYTKKISEELAWIKKEYDDIASSLEEHKHTNTFLKHLIGLDVSFHDLKSMQYVEFRIGTVPTENLLKLEYFDNKALHFIPIDNSGSDTWGIYLAPKNSIEFADAVMSSLFFRPADIPDYLVADPATTTAILDKVIVDEEKIKEDLQKKIDEYIAENRSEMLAALSKLKYLNDCFELRKKAFVSGDSFTFAGYCPTRNSNELCEKLSAVEGLKASAVAISSKGAPTDVPVKLRNNIVFRPFEMFVKMYGLPEYGTFDPTPYVAVTYMLLFGIMFGDVGQGLVISLLGILLSIFTKNGLAPIMTRIGLCSAAMGVVYGSVFGIETIIEPFFHRENIWKLLGYTERPENIFQVSTTLLIAALGIGIVLIAISMTFNTVLNFSKHKIGEALFSVNGVCGLTFYISLIAGAAGMMMFGVDLFSPAYVICLILLPLILIFFKHPLSDLISGKKHTEKVSVGNFIIENFIELFEAALSFLSNTMSFLRVGGFILSHAGMMLVVGQLAGTNAPGAEISVTTVIVYILGNLFVMGVEGLLVGIQILRLEFYEIFNRFYSGNGQSFRPLEITFEQN